MSWDLLCRKKKKKDKKRKREDDDDKLDVVGMCCHFAHVLNDSV